MFCVTVMKKYEALEQVDSVDEFKKAFVDVVNGTFSLTVFYR